MDNQPVPSSPKLSAVVCAAAVIALSGCSFGGGTSPAVRTITIGVSLPLTGGEGRAGSSTLNGVRFFVSRHPTLDGFSIALDVRDDASFSRGDTAHGVRNLEAFIAASGVIAMIGPFDSGTARAGIPLSLIHI